MPPKALTRFGFVPAAASVASTSAPQLPSTPQESASLEPQFQRSSEHGIVKLVVRHKTSWLYVDRFWFMWVFWKAENDVIKTSLIPTLSDQFYKISSAIE